MGLGIDTTKVDQVFADPGNILVGGIADANRIRTISVFRNQSTNLNFPNMATQGAIVSASAVAQMAGPLGTNAGAGVPSGSQAFGWGGGFTTNQKWMIVALAVPADNVIQATAINVGTAAVDPAGKAIINFLAIR